MSADGRVVEGDGLKIHSTNSRRGFEPHSAHIFLNEITNWVKKINKNACIDKQR